MKARRNNEEFAHVNTSILNTLYFYVLHRTRSGRIDEMHDSGAIDADLPSEYMEKRVAFCCYQ